MAVRRAPSATARPSGLGGGTGPSAALHDIDTDRPRLIFRDDHGAQQLECDFIAVYDGLHGISRPSIPDGALTIYHFEYGFAWLGITARAAPATDGLIYAWNERGFALHSMRSREVSRPYLQVTADEQLERWPDERIWEELQERFATEGWSLNEGEVFDKGTTPMRSFVCEPMQYGRVFLAGDSAHIVPPTGAKGLNLAVNDARLLARRSGAVRRALPGGTRALFANRASPGVAGSGLLQLHDAASARPRARAV